MVAANASEELNFPLVEALLACPLHGTVRRRQVPAYNVVHRRSWGSLAGLRGYTEGNQQLRGQKYARIR